MHGDETMSRLLFSSSFEAYCDTKHCHDPRQLYREKGSGDILYYFDSQHLWIQLIISSLIFVSKHNNYQLMKHLHKTMICDRFTVDLGNRRGVVYLIYSFDELWRKGSLR